MRDARTAERDGAVAVTIVAYDSAALLPSCLAAVTSLHEVTEVVVVDHGAGDSADVAGRAGVRVLRDPSNPGFGAGHNRAVAATSAPYLLLLNPDAVLDAAAVARGLAVLEANGSVAAVQGAIGSPEGVLDRSQGVALAPVHLLGRALAVKRLSRLRLVRLAASRVPAVRDSVVRRSDDATEVESLAATAMLVRRDAFEEVDGFDERFFLYGEDQDLCRRLRQRGWRLVGLPQPWALHQNGSSFASSWQRELHWWRGTMMYGARWWTGRDWALGVLAGTIMWSRLAMRRPSGAREAARALVVAPLRDRRRSRQEASTAVRSR